MLVKRTNKPSFTPVTIEITFESIEELQQLWHLTNASWFNLCQYFLNSKHYHSPEHVPIPEIDSGDGKLWRAIDNILREQGAYCDESNTD